MWWLSHCPWRYLKDVKMGCLRTWFSGGAGLTVGLDNFKVLFQPKCFYDSMIL